MCSSNIAMTIRGITAFTMFAVVGPPIGSTLFVAPMLVRGDLVSVIFAIPFSYLFGLPPAILAGVLYLLGYKLIGHSTNARLLSLCLGALAGFLSVISVLAPALMFDIAGTKDFMSGNSE